MREPNLGINRSCVWCGSSFFCTDGDFLCSTKCSDAYESIHDEDDEEL